MGDQICSQSIVDKMVDIAEVAAEKHLGMDMSAGREYLVLDMIAEDNHEEPHHSQECMESDQDYAEMEDNMTELDWEHTVEEESGESGSH